jgi:regulator of RNase E activity RraA
MEGEVNETLSHHETLLAWTGFLSKAPSNKVVICQPQNNEVALMGELSAETLQQKGVKGYIVDGGARDMDFILKIDFPVWSSFYTPRDVVGYWHPTKFEQPITIGKTVINNNDYVLADIDGVVIIPSNIIENILDRAEKLISTENLVRKSIREGMDPQEAYLKYSVF